MKKIIKMIILILFICFTVNVNAKQLVSEPFKFDSDITYSSNEIILQDDDGIITIGNSEFDGINLISYNDPDGDFYRILKYTYEGEIISEKSVLLHINQICKGIITKDNNIILIGKGTTQDDEERTNKGSAIIYKIDLSGNVLWSNKYEIQNKINYFYDVIETEDGEFIAVGISDSYNSNPRFAIMAKYSSSGNLVWQKDFLNKIDNALEHIIKKDDNNYIVTTIDYSPSVIVDSSGNYISDFEFNEAGKILKKTENGWIFASDTRINSNESIVEIKKYNKNGRRIKETIIEFDNPIVLNSFEITKDNNYLISGYLGKYNSNENYDTYYFSKKINATNNNIIWNYERKYDADIDSTQSYLYETNNEEYINIINNPENKIEFIQLKNNGEIKNIKKHLNIFESMENIFAARSPLDDGFVFAGLGNDRKSAIYGGYDISYVKYDKNGKIVFDKSFGGSDSEYINAFKETKDNGYIIAGSTHSNNIKTNAASNALILKIDKNGEIEWYKTFYGSQYYNDFYDVIQLKDGNYIAVGRSTDNYMADKNHAIIVKYDQNGNIIWSKNYSEDKYKRFDKLIQINNDKIIVIGCTSLEPQIDKCYSSRTIFDLDGNIKYENIYDESNLVSYKNIFKTNDNGYIIYELESYSDRYQFIKWYSKYNSNNELVWRNKFSDNENYSNINFIELDNSYLIFGKNPEDYRDLTVSLTYINKANGENIESYDITEMIENLSYYYLMDDGTIRCFYHNGEADTIEGYPGIIDIYYKYDINKKTSSNGTFTVDKIKAKNKEIITINAKPKLGYIVDKVIVTDSKGNKTEFRDLTFEMIPDDVEVEILFKEFINPKTGFRFIGIITMIGVLLYFTLRKKKLA